MGTGQVGNLKSNGSPFMEKGRLRAFLRPYSKKAGELLNLSRNQLCIMTELFYLKLPFKRSSI
jgi:hypothetical protein